MNSLLRVLGYLKPYKPLVGLTFSFATITTLLDLVPPWLVKVIIDSLVDNKGGNFVYWATGGLVLAFLGRNYSNHTRIRYNNKLEQKVVYDLRSDVYQALQKMSLTYFENRSTGEIMSRVTEDVGNVERIFIDGVEQIITAILTLVGITIILFALHWKLALVSLIPIPLLFFGAVAYTRRAQDLYQVNRERSAQLISILQDTLSGIRETLAFNRQLHEIERFNRRSKDLCRGTLSVMRLWSIYSPAMMFLGSLGTIFILLYGIGLVREGVITVGSLVAFMGYLALFYQPINQLHSLNHMLQHAVVSGRRVFEIMDTEPEVRESPDAYLPSTNVQGTIIFDSVSFSYVKGTQVLHELSFSVRPGEKVALVGHTGSGKSTLIKLLLRFYDADSGTILLDEHPVRDLPITYLREQIGLVSQDPFLFNGTAAENILYGNLNASADEVIVAAKGAFAHEFIEKLPQGYDTPLGERGVKLSGGEKTRIAIARAFLKNPPILVLDEATAAVDTATEEKIKAALKNLMVCRTTLVIAHRLSTLEDAGRIMVLKNGFLVETGNHQDLMRQDSVYAGLFRSQAHL